MKTKQKLRDELLSRFQGLWPESDLANGPPLFPERGRAAERLRRLPEYRKARTMAVMPDSVLLQARINALNDGKDIIVATPGLKQGLVRVTPDDVPVARRNRGPARAHHVQGGPPLALPPSQDPPGWICCWPRF